MPLLGKMSLPSHVKFRTPLESTREPCDLTGGRTRSRFSRQLRLHVWLAAEGLNPAQVHIRRAARGGTSPDLVNSEGNLHTRRYARSPN